MQPPKTQTQTQPQPQPQKKISTPIKFSFTITYILLLTTATITFIEAMRTPNPMVRHILNLETCISVVAGYFYSVFAAKIADYERMNSPINWTEIAETRYVDWSITTPLMLIVLCVVLSNEINLQVRLPIIAIIIGLNYAMLYAGYLGETNRIDRTAANILGFLPFFAMFGVIYWKYVAPKFNLANRVLFYFYLVVWSLYGIVYIFDVETRNIAMNILDLFAKCLIGFGLWVYYVHIIRL
jgi:bacteriorhodopsin